MIAHLSMEPQKKQRNYTTAFKMEAIENAKKKKNSCASRKFGIDVRRICKWRNQKNEIWKMVEETLKGKARQKLEGGGRKAYDEELEEIMLDWVFIRGANGLRVLRKLIRYKATSVYDDKNPEERDKFVAPPG